MMKNNLKKLFATILAAAAIATIIPAPAKAVYTAPTDIVRVGLYNDTQTYASANLQNVSGTGYGYEFGYYDSNRQFISLGASDTSTDKITMVIDRNMTYNSSSNSYSEGTGGSVVVGCYHIKLDRVYPDYYSARADADMFTSANAFVRYENGSFYVCVGDYISQDEAVLAASGMNIASSYTIDSGSSYTVAVVATGTDRIIFEFDCGTSYSLAVRPISSGGKTQTWFKRFRYYGDFVYWRNTGGNLTVINYVNVDDYVKGVIPYEMSPSWPLEAQKAGAISARTYVMANLNKHSTKGFDVCNTIDCQVYKGTGSATSTSDAAVDETAGQYLTYQNELCETYYYSSNGGASEDSENVWNGSIPYLRGKEDPYEEAVADSISNYYWSVTYTGSELAAKLRSRGYNCGTIVGLEVSRFTDMGNVYSITFTDVNGKNFTFSKESARTVLGLRSQRYTVNGQSTGTDTGTGDPGSIYVNSSSGQSQLDTSEVYAIGSDGVSQVAGDGIYAITGSGLVEAVGEGGQNTSGTGSSGGSSSNTSGTFTITGSGYGHNVGMSQWGAYSMAKYYNMTCEEILTFYYTGAEVTTSY